MYLWGVENLKLALANNFSETLINEVDRKDMKYTIFGVNKLSPFLYISLS